MALAPSLVAAGAGIRVRKAVNRRPVAAPGIPLLGNAIDLFRRPLEFFVQSYYDVGPVFRASGPGRSYVVLAGPRANTFLAHEGERYLDNRPIYRQVAGELRSGNYAIATDGEQHTHLRRTLKPAFSHKSLSRYLPRMLATADQLVREWRPGMRLRVLDTMHRLVGEQLGAALVGRALGGDLADAVTFARYSVGAGLGAYPTFMARFPHYLAAKHRMFALMRDIVAEHRNNPPGRNREPDFVDLLLESTDHEGQPLSDDDVIANAQMAYSNAMLYGGPACAFLLYALLKYPDARARVQAEVDAAFADGIGDARAFFSLKHLHGAMLESMRLFPIALATPRLVVKPFELEGYEVRPGDVTLFAVSVCHFLPEIFPDPYTFDIDRYSDPRNEHHQPAMFVRFGLGTHACAGMGLVEMFVMTTLAAILRHVELTLDPPGYTLRRVVNPFPEPERKLAVRVTVLRP